MGCPEVTIIKWKESKLSCHHNYDTRKGALKRQVSLMHKKSYPKVCWGLEFGSIYTTQSQEGKHCLMDMKKVAP